MMKTLLTAAMFYSVVPLFATSYYPARLNDAKAIYLTPDNFPVKGDGIADDTAVLQQAIDKVQEKTNQGILFVPAGRYRLTRTIYIWPGIRLIGFGTARPTFVLAAGTPGFQQGPTYMVFFAGARPRADKPPPDASPGTFYSAISNLDIEIQDGNPGAVGIRAHYAQHCFLAHMDFHIGSGLAGGKVRLKVQRGGRTIDMEATLAKFKNEMPYLASVRPEPVFGLRVDYSSVLAQVLFGGPFFGGARFGEIPKGVVVREVAADSPAAAKFKLLGDNAHWVITHVNGTPTLTPPEFYKAAKGQQSLKLTVIDPTETNGRQREVTLP